MSSAEAATVPELLNFFPYTAVNGTSSFNHYGCSVVTSRTVAGTLARIGHVKRAKQTRRNDLAADSHVSDALPDGDGVVTNYHAFATNSTAHREILCSASSSNPVTSGSPPPPPPLNEATRVAIVGVGYVGASLLKEFMRPFPRTIGYDVSSFRIEQLKSIFDTSYKERSADITFTSDASQLEEASYYMIAVPTLLRHEATTGTPSDDDKSPPGSTDSYVDLEYVRSAAQTIVRHCRPGSVIVIESSVSVGTTRMLLAPYGQLIHGGMSPERVDPGRVTPPTASVPKVVSGLTPVATAAIVSLYQSCYEHVVPVSSPEVAEMTKLHENCFRMVNIAYANEVADVCRSLGIDFREVVDAARTKPYGFMPFSAGLGVGGHCIPVNPYYLMDSCKKGALPLLERATKMMKQRPYRLAKSFHRRVLLEMAKRQRISVSDVAGRRLPRVLLVGIGFKPGQSVLSHSPGLAFATALHSIGCEHVSFYDPLVDTDALPDDAVWLQKMLDKEWMSNNMQDSYDGIAVCMKQHGIDWSSWRSRRKSPGCYIRWFAHERS